MKRGDVVVGVVAAVGADQPVADAVGRRQAGQVGLAAKDRGGLSRRPWRRLRVRRGRRAYRSSRLRATARRCTALDCRGDPPHRPPSLPLARLLGHAADAVARGARRPVAERRRSTRCPADGAARARRRSPSTPCAGSARPRRCARRLAPKAPPPEVDALLLDRAGAALAGRRRRRTPTTRWSTRRCAAARRRAPRSAGFVNAVLRRFVREREALVAAGAARPGGALQPSALVDRAPAGRLARPLAGDRSPPTTCVRR